MKILIAVIDDDKAYQFVSKRNLQRAGFQEYLLQFYDGQEALDYFKSNQNIAANLPDLAFLDINMPYLDGWQFLEQLSFLNLVKKDITFYIVTSSPSAEDIVRAGTFSKVTGYRVKPITSETLIGLIEQTVVKLKAKSCSVPAHQSE